MTHRLVNTAKREIDYNRDMHTIKLFAVNNNFKVKMINDIINQKAFKKTMNLNYSQTNNKNSTSTPKLCISANTFE